MQSVDRIKNRRYNNNSCFKTSKIKGDETKMKTKKNIWEERFYGKEGLFRQEIFRIPHQDLPKFIELLQGMDAKRILDLGCGTGRHVITLAKQGFRVFGIDVSKKALKVTEERLNEGGLEADLKMGDIYKRLPYEDNWFDAVISIKVLHHAKVSEIRKLIRELERVMRPCGILMIEVPKSGKRHGRKRYKKLETGTFTPLQGPEKGMPHHIFRNEYELRRFFSNFDILDIHATGRDNIQTPSPHYTMFARLKKNSSSS